MLRIISLIIVCSLHTNTSWCQEVKMTTNGVKCNGESNGIVNIEISNSSGEYNVRILKSDNNRLIIQKQFNSDTTFNIHELDGGDYQIQLTSKNGNIEKQFKIEQPDELKANSIRIIQGVSSQTECVGIIEAQPSGGTKPYSYEWSDNARKVKTNEVKELCPGIYRCIITDANNCEQVSATAYLLIEE